MDYLPFSFFEKSKSSLEGYVSQLANNNYIPDIPILSTKEVAGSKTTNIESFNMLMSDSSNIYVKYADLSNNINNYISTRTQQEGKYELIDACGNLIYKKNTNFKENIPPVKDAVLEDSISVMNYNNYIYTISGIAVAFLAIGIIIVK